MQAENKLQTFDNYSVFFIAGWPT